MWSNDWFGLARLRAGSRAVQPSVSVLAVAAKCSGYFRIDPIERGEISGGPHVIAEVRVRGPAQIISADVIGP